MSPYKAIPSLPLAFALGIAALGCAALPACVDEGGSAGSTSAGSTSAGSTSAGSTSAGSTSADSTSADSTAADSTAAHGAAAESEAAGKGAAPRSAESPNASEAAEAKRPRTRKPPPAASERRDERLRMVETQIARPRDGRRPVRDEKVLEAMRAVPRHAFVPRELSGEAYADYPLPIGHDQTISQPYIVAWMTELLDLGPDSRVLEVGTGSAYQAAVLAHLTPHVWTIEIVEPLARRARKTLDEQGYTEVRCRHGDGYAGWKEEAPFDAILVTCAPESIPPPLWEQLAPGGRIVIPVGGRFQVQRLVVVRKTEAGERKTEEVSYVRFVPLTRQPSLEGEDLESEAKGKDPESDAKGQDLEAEAEGRDLEVEAAAEAKAQAKVEGRQDP